MKLYSKLRPALLVLSLSFFCSLPASAQFPGMAAVRAQQNQQFMNQQMQTQMQMMANINWRQNAGQGGSYYVTFKDSTRKGIVSYMYYDTIKRKNFLVFVNKKFPKSDSAHRYQKIYPEQTLNLAFGQTEAKYGLPNDSGWTFKVVTGAITVYAKNDNYAALTETPVSGGLIIDFVPEAIIGIRLNEGPMEKLTKETVSKMISQDAKAVSILRKKGMLEAVERYNEDIEKAAKKNTPVSEN